MIKNWTLRNFKSIYKETTLEFAPLTIFAGANSSGKSTIIQSILLTTQTLQNPVNSKAVILNGHIIRLGAFDDVISNNAVEDEILIGFNLSPLNKESKMIPSHRNYYIEFSHNSEDIKEIDCRYIFSAKGAYDEKDIHQLQPRLESSQLRVRSVFADHDSEIHLKRSEKGIENRLKNYKIRDSLNAHFNDYEVVKVNNLGKNLYGRRFLSNSKLVGASLMHFLPGRITYIYDVIEEKVERIIQYLISDYEYLDSENIKTFNEILSSNDSLKEVFLKELNIFDKIIDSDTIKNRFNKSKNKLENNFNIENFKKCLRSLPQKYERRLLEQHLAKISTDLKKIMLGNRSEYSLTSVPLPDISNAAVDYIKMYFGRKVKYLGPLRDDPKPVYPFSGGTDSMDIGFRGENTAAVLEIHRNMLIKYIPSSCFNNIIETYEEQVPLSEAVLDWLKYMGVASGVKTADKGKLGHELKVSAPGAETLHDLTHVGVGVSQVLPILVQSLLADTGSTLVFEQPELHLHPRVQNRLADFFVSMIKLKKQCIIETHSEYFINRLRFHSAISEKDNLSKEIIIYFVEKEGGQSLYRPVKINKYGVIEKWPKGFFDENEDNAAAILRAGMIKRKRESQYD
ncbi:hypothetical protein BHU72_09960 [Desulfuribacillus stibiiarsenatis]|uniref:AAA domain-containing protein n=1 Tax=Desulfuribacillus stibiiarsenatis TaxID=1390249 RepID=A0A1E5L8X5_9FIRM|nr:DUF3696 domain-containing protein [Desulfuribacillus stibiiarsenatis]OEH86576.1 hypothetical protein BHU72_09960 [Desulfuribacillus stibiiarsenatis]